MAKKKIDKVKVFTIDAERKLAALTEGKHEGDFDGMRHPTAEYEVERVSDSGGYVNIRLKKIDKKDKEKRLRKIAKILAPNVKVEDLVLDALGELIPDEITKIEDRLAGKDVRSKPAVKSKEGCYKLHIGGKKGRPLELFLRD